MLYIPHDTELSLYLHIPFCTTRCHYCAFYSEAYPKWKDCRQAYVERLRKEIEQVVEQVSGFETIFIGGGNPGSLTFEQLQVLLQTAQKNRRSREVTLEMNPETFRRDLFPLFETALVTRLSMGIQSMNDSLLTLLGRNARLSDNLRGISLANEVRSLYGTDLSFDLMTCLPGQTTEMAESDIRTVLDSADVNHLSVYCLTIEEGTALAERVGKGDVHVQSDDEQQHILFHVWNYLKKQGFEHYEISNFARQGNYCVHNQIYWNLKPYIGLGSSSASTLFEGPASWHYSQIQDLHDFSKHDCFSGYEREDILFHQQIEEFVMMALRTNTGISKKEFSIRFNLDFDTLFAKSIASLDLQWFVDNSLFFTLTEIGSMLLDEIVLRLITDIPQPLDRH